MTSWYRVVDALAAEPGIPLTVKGWVRSHRQSKADGGLSFISISDGTCFDTIQVVARCDLPNYEQEVLPIPVGAAVEVEGELVASQGKGQAVEIAAATVSLVGDIMEPQTYPISKKRHSFEYLREVAHLRPRTNTFGAVARVRHCLVHGDPPLLRRARLLLRPHAASSPPATARAPGRCSASRTLDLRQPAAHATTARSTSHQDFFGRETHLTVSRPAQRWRPTPARSRTVYTFGPTFRAENSNTTRHLAEFWMIEPEMAFCDLDDDADLAEDMLKYCFDDAADQLRRRHGRSSTSASRRA